MNFILDSNIFDKLLKGKIDLNLITKSCHTLYLTHIQIDELNNIPDNNLRAKLFLVINQIKSELIPTESFVIGKSRIGHAKIGDGKTIEKIRKGNLKRSSDALIGETALKNNLILVTEDKQLIKNIKELKGEVVNFEVFNQLLNEITHI